MIHAIEYYSAIKKNKLLIYRTTFMNLKIITLSEHSQNLPQLQKKKKEYVSYNSI